MQNPAMLNRAICLAKKVDVAIQMSRRPRASESGSPQQKVKPIKLKPNSAYIGHLGRIYYGGQNQKQNNFF